MLRCNALLLLAVLLAESGTADEPARETAYPDKTWQRRQPEQVRLDKEKLEALRDLVGGRGCIVRHGYLVFSWGGAAKSGDVASAFKPLLSTLLMLALQEGRLKTVDDPVAHFEPRLKAIERGDLTWRHLASQTSGYGLTEAPGKAYAYNDYALALYYDTLIHKVFDSTGDEVLKSRLAGPLQFEDRHTFEAFGPKDRPGRLAVSVRDFARFGLLILREGRWRDKQIVRKDLVKLMLNSPLPADTPLTEAKDGPMLTGQRTIGGGKNITRIGPGYYSFNWWLNGADKDGRRLFADAPLDTIVASGHGGKRMLWIIPSLDLIAVWNDSTVNDHDASPTNPRTRCNHAARLLVAAARIKMTIKGP